MATTEAQVRAYLEPEEPNYPAAAAALGAEALPVLETLVRGADPLLASKAAYLASMIPGDQAARVLEEAARSAHPTVRVAAAAGMQTNLDVSGDAVAALMADPDPGVRKVAAKTARRRAAPGTRTRTPEREPGRSSAGGGASPEGSGGGQISEDEHGGGAAPDTSRNAEASAGEGGGDIGGARFGVLLQSGGAEAESGGGGDLTGTGTAGAPVGSLTDGPDGGGTAGGGAGDSNLSAHGGGRF
jgi:hypothetical protein